MQNASFFLCDTDTGAVLSKISGHANKTRLAPNRVLVPAGTRDINEYYYDTATQSLSYRRPFEEGELADGYYTVALPKGTQAVWQGELHIVNDGVLSVRVDQPGAHRLRLFHPLYVITERIIEN